MGSYCLSRGIIRDVKQTLNLFQAYSNVSAIENLKNFRKSDKI